MDNKVKNIITIGASAGGISACAQLISALRSDLNAAVFIVIHVSRNSLTDVILAQLQKHTGIACKVPSDGDKILNNTIYLAPVDRHMMIEKGHILIRKGAFENHWRPSIDVLFRSAAAAYGSCVTGIILTGLLDDGTSGMSAIKRSKGKCIVQDPQDADFPDMPQNVLRNVEVDFKVPISDMGYILSDLFSREACVPNSAPEDVVTEAKITMRMSTDLTDLEKLGTLTPFSCPDCGGTLLKLTNDPVTRYRCYTGHAFTEKTLESEQIKGLEESLWVAIRMMEERKNLLNSMSGQNEAAKLERSSQMVLHIERLKKTLLEIGKGHDKSSTRGGS